MNAFLKGLVYAKKKEALHISWRSSIEQVISWVLSNPLDTEYCKKALTVTLVDGRLRRHFGKLSATPDYGVKRERGLLVTY